MKTKILGTGSYVPEFVADNDYLSTFLDTNDDWIRERTGIERRHLAGTETTAGMAARAAAAALENAKVSAEEIDLILVGTLSPDHFFPSTACMVQEKIGAVNASAFDLNAACSGFLFGLVTADAYLRAGLAKKVLVIGSETMSKMVDWSDRSCSILFGDGAGAAVVAAGENGMDGSIIGSDGSRGSVLTCRSRENENPVYKEAFSKDYMYMDGQEVFKFAVKKVPECITALLEQTGTSPEEIQYYLLHQANQRIIQSVSKRLKQPMEKFPMNLQEYGNTSAASLGILLDEMNRKNQLKAGDRLILSGFGAGLTWGAVLLEW